MGLTKCCCCVDLLKGVKILGIVQTVLVCLFILIIFIAKFVAGYGLLYELIALIPGLNFLKL